MSCSRRNQLHFLNPPAPEGKGTPCCGSFSQGYVEPELSETKERRSSFSCSPACEVGLRVWGGAKSQRQAHSQVIGQVVLLQGVRFKAVGHRVEVIIAYPTDEALGLEEKKNVKMSECRKQNKRRTLRGSCIYSLYKKITMEGCAKYVPISLLPHCISL